MDISFYIKGKLLKDQIFEFALLGLSYILNSPIKYLDCNSKVLYPDGSELFLASQINQSIILNQNSLWMST